MPMLMMFLIGLPVWPRHWPLRTRLAKAAILSSSACTLGTTSWPSTMIFSLWGARRATCRTARRSVTLIFSPRNMASIRSRKPLSAASCKSSFERLGGDQVFRVVEVHAQCFGGKARAAVRIVGEEIAQVGGADLLGVLLERFPGGALGDGRHHGNQWGMGNVEWGMSCASA